MRDREERVSEEGGVNRPIEECAKVLVVVIFSAICGEQQHATTAVQILCEVRSLFGRKIFTWSSEDNQRDISECISRELFFISASHQTTEEEEGRDRREERAYGETR
jgi:hypothetical protein